jgi:site-specific recombinase XerD
MNLELKTQIEKFLKWSFVIKNQSKNTLENYTRYLKLFLDFS